MPKDRSREEARRGSNCTCGRWLPSFAATAEQPCCQATLNFRTRGEEFVRAMLSMAPQREERAEWMSPVGVKPTLALE